MLLFGLVTLVDGILVTNSVFDITHPGLLGVSYDDLAASLLEGSARVRRSSICWEYFQVGADTYMYFGPFPALLRIVGNGLLPEMYGHWSRYYVSTR